MRILTLISVLAFALLLVGCTAEQMVPEQQTTGGETVAEPTEEQMESDLDTASLDEIESDLDLLVLE